MKARKPTLVLSFLLALSVVAFGLSPFLTSKVNAAPGWLVDPVLAYRKSHEIANLTGAGTNYQVKIVVINDTGIADSGGTVYTNKTQSDFDDIRFTDNDETTLLDYWVEEVHSGENATFWVEVQDDLSSANATIYMYYGNATISSASNGTNTFPFFDHFPGVALDSKWNTTGAPAVANSNLTVQVAAGGAERAYSNATFSGYYALRANGTVGPKHLSKSKGFGWCSVPIGPQSPNLTIVWQCKSTYSGFTNVICGNGTSHTITALDADYGAGNAWHMWEVQRNGTADKFLIDGVTKHTETGTHSLNTSRHVFFEDGETNIALVFDWVLVRKFVEGAAGEPVHGGWGAEEESTANTAPTNEGVTVTNMDDTNYLYSMKRYYQFQGKYNDSDGTDDLDFVMVAFTDGANWVNASFDVQADSWSLVVGSSYAQIDTGSCTNSTSGNQLTVTWHIRLFWNISDSANIEVYQFCNDTSDDGPDWQQKQSNYANIETDLDVHSASLNDTDARCNPSQNLMVSGVITYHGSTAVSPPDGDYQVKAWLNGTTQKGSADATLVSGVYNITDVTAEATIGRWFYRVNCTYIESTNDTGNIDVEKVDITITIGDHVININTNASISISGTYQYNSDSFSGSFTLNYTTYSHAVAQIKGYTVSSISGGSYGVTTIGTNDEDYVVWESVTISIGGPTDQRINVAVNASGISVSGTYDYYGTPYDGSFTLNDTTYDYATPGRRGYTVASITGDGYGITAISTNDETHCIWDNLTMFNLQTVQYLGDGEYRYQAQIKYGYDGAAIDGAYVNVSLPAGASIGQLTSNSSGWIVFVLDQTNASTTGTYTIYGVDDNTYNITVASVNQTFILRSWTLNSQDNDGNTLSATTINMTVTASRVWNGSDTAVRVPEDTFNVTVTWQSLQVNQTLDISISGDTTTNFNCTAYPYTYSGTRYWVAANATVSSTSWSSNILTVEFSGAVQNYTFKASCTTKPRYVLNCTYDYSTDWATILTLSHYGNTTIKVGYPNWVVYMQKTDQRLTTIGWSGEQLSLTFTGQTGENGEVELYCGSRGAPEDYEGFTTGSYSSNTKVFTGAYSFSSDKTVKVTWTVTPGGTPGGGGETVQAANLLINIEVESPPTILVGSTVPAVITVKWSGAPIIYVYDVEFDMNASWFTIAGLPFKLQKARDTVQGESTIELTIEVPEGTPQGEYNIPCTVIFRTEAAQEVTVGGTMEFAVSGPPSTVPEYMTILFLVCIAAIFIVAVTRTKP